MKKNQNKIPKSALNAEKLHRQVVGRLLAQPLAPNRRLAAPLQWGLWILIILVAVGMMALSMGTRSLKQGYSTHPSGLIFLLLALALTVMTSWEAFASSIPGRRTSSGYKLTACLTLGALALFPFFPPHFGGLWQQSEEVMAGSLKCAVSIFTLGLMVWAGMAWMLSRNAAVRPGWTGACSGLAAFMVGAIIIQWGCPNWHSGHLWVSHLLPVAVAAGLTAYLGKRWFFQ